MHTSPRLKKGKAVEITAYPVKEPTSKSRSGMLDRPLHFGGEYTRCRAATSSRARHANVVYITVWLLVGTFFVASVYFSASADSWRGEGRLVFGFFYVYVLTLALGFVLQIIGAVLLRWLARVTRLNAPAHWIGFGAALGIVLPWICARAGYVLEAAYFRNEWQSVKSALMFPLMGAMMYETRSAWVLAAVGAATAGTVRVLMASRLR